MEQAPSIMQKMDSSERRNVRKWSTCAPNRRRPSAANETKSAANTSANARSCRAAAWNVAPMSSVLSVCTLSRRMKYSVAWNIATANRYWYVSASCASGRVFRKPSARAVVNENYYSYLVCTILVQYCFVERTEGERGTYSQHVGSCC